MQKIPGVAAIRKYSLFLLIFFSFILSSHFAYSADTDTDSPFIQVAGLIDNRSTFSDGEHSIEELVMIARSRGFKTFFINDHDRIAIAYGLPPFKNILRYKKELPSIQTNGVKKYLQEIDRVSSMFPDMLIIPGCETSAYYYWTGSYFKEDLTAHDYDKRILILNFDEPDDYNNIPNLHNKMSMRYTKRLLPAAMIFFGCLLMGVYLILCKGIFRILGFIFIIFSILTILNNNPFRSSMFTQYDGDQGIAPYQELIDYVNERGGFTFWNYPEQKSGIRKHGPIFVNTPMYPEVIHESQNYTGFAAIYGEYTKATKPGGEWDIVLNEYCNGKREKPPWAISTGDFHEDGRLGLKLGAFPTTFLVKEFSKKAILESIEKGRMYCSRGNGKTWPKLVDFNISGDNETKYYMGETLTSSQFPIISFNITYETEKPKPITVHLIRGGDVIKTFEEKPPIKVEYRDENIPQGKKTYYRVMDPKEKLVSNPIFVTYDPES
ncbi:hypothetical protein ACFL6W_04715 [Thermodesulfobacteriota bacterium]